MNGNKFLNVLLVLLVTMPFAVEAAGAPATVRELIIIGLQQNIGLQVEQLNVPVAAAAVVGDEAVFDAEAFAAGGYQEAAVPLASALSLTEYGESAQWSGQVGLRKKYTGGLLAALHIDTQWTDHNDLSEALDPRYHTAFTLNLRQPLLRDFGSLVNTSNLQIARQQYTQAQWRYLLQAQTLALQIELLSSQLAGQTEIVGLRRAAVELAEQLRAANQRRFTVGVIPVSEIQEADTALANRRLELSLAQQSRELSFEQLKRQLQDNLSPTTDLGQLYSFATEAAQVDLPAMDRLFAAARQKNVQLEIAGIDLHTAQLRRSYAANQLKPQFDLVLQAGLQGLAGEQQDADFDSRFVGGWEDSLGRAAEADGYQWGVGLEFSLPLGNRLAGAQLQQAKLQARQAAARRQDLEAELQSLLQQQVNTLRRASEQVTIAARFEHLARLSLQQEQRRLEEGLSDTFRILSFQDNMINAQIGRITALMQYHASFARLNFTRGITLEQHAIVLPQMTEEVVLELP